MRIDGRGPVSGPAGARPQKAGSGEGFSLPRTAGASASAAAGSVAASQGASGLDSLIALQANEDSTERRKRQARRGHDLLDGLDRLKASLLSGRVSLAELERIRANLSLRREATDDPRLDDVLAHIELRAAVELAKLGR